MSKIKLYSVIVLGCALFLSQTGFAHAADVDAYLSPSTGDYTGNFTIKVRVTGSDIAGVDFTLTYDDDLVSVSSLSKGSGVSTWTETTKSTSSGQINYVIDVAAGDPQPITGPAEVAAIAFSSSSSGTLALTFTDFDATDSSSSALTVESSNGSYVLSSSTSGTGGSLPGSAESAPILLNLFAGGFVAGLGAIGVLSVRSHKRKNIWCE